MMAERWLAFNAEVGHCLVCTELCNLEARSCELNATIHLQNFLPQPFRQPGAPFGSGNGWDLPPALLNQAFTAFLIQQQQMANAAMMMMEPLYAAQGQGQQIALDGGP